MHHVKQDKGRGIFWIERSVGKFEMPPGWNAMFATVVLGHAGEGPGSADFRQKPVELFRRLMAENIRVNRKAADVRKAEQQTRPALENEFQFPRRQRVQQRESVDGLRNNGAIACQH